LPKSQRGPRVKGAMDAAELGRIHPKPDEFPHAELGTTPRTDPIVENVERAKTVPGLAGLWGEHVLKMWRAVQILFATKIREGEYDVRKVVAAMAMRGKMARLGQPMTLFTPEGRSSLAEMQQVAMDLADFDNLYGVLSPPKQITLRLMLQAFEDKDNLYPPFSETDADREVYRLAVLMMTVHTEVAVNVSTDQYTNSIIDNLGPRRPEQVLLGIRAQDDPEGKGGVFMWTTTSALVSAAEEAWLDHYNGVDRNKWRLVKPPNTVLFQRDKTLGDYGVQGNDELVVYTTKDIATLLCKQ
jgi:hypothetical protein